MCAQAPQAQAGGKGKKKAAAGAGKKEVAKPSGGVTKAQGKGKAPAKAAAPAAAARSDGAGPSSAAGPSPKVPASAAKRAKAAAAAAPEPAGTEEEGGGAVVHSWTGRRYPASLCCRPGDKRVAEYENDTEEAEGDFEVEAIVDETKIGARTFYLVKWKGFELRPGDGRDVKGDWEPEAHLKGCAALAKWRKDKPAYFTAA